MNKNWILLLFVTIALVSCSVEKRVYQPGYHIEWNHFAKQDAEQDASRDVAQDAERDATQDVAQDAERDATQDVAQDATQDVAQDVTQDISQDAPQNVARDVSRSEKIHEVIKSLSPVQSTNILAETKFVQSIDADLEFVLYIILSLFLPALTVFLMEGFSKNFWIALLLMILAFALPVPLFLQLLIEGLAIVLAIAVVLHYL
jgi:uncharacterized membrane protein YqaE (UPF0057 family)